MVPQSGLSDRVIIVTGAGKGLGRAYALQLAAAGAAVVVNNRWSDRKQPSSADAVAAEIRAGGGRAVTYSVVSLLKLATFFSCMLLIVSTYKPVPMPNLRQPSYVDKNNSTLS